jgi:hypothetical protein
MPSTLQECPEIGNLPSPHGAILALLSGATRVILQCYRAALALARYGGYKNVSNAD